MKDNIFKDILKREVEKSLGERKKLYRFILERIEKPLIEIVLNKTSGNQLQAARILGINRNTLHSKIKKFRIRVENFKVWE